MGEYNDMDNFPKFNLFKKGVADKPVEYTGAVTQEDLVRFLKKEGGVHIGLRVSALDCSFFLGFLEHGFLIAVLELGCELVKVLQGALKADMHPTFLLEEAHKVFLSNSTGVLHRLVSCSLLEQVELRKIVHVIVLQILTSSLVSVLLRNVLVHLVAIRGDANIADEHICVAAGHSGGHCLPGIVLLAIRVLAIEAHEDGARAV